MLMLIFFVDNGFILVLNHTPTEVSLTESSDSDNNEDQCYSNTNMCERKKTHMTIDGATPIPLSIKDWW